MAREIIRQARVADADCILEFGAGTGAFTAEILKKKKPDAHFMVVERSPELVQTLRARFPDTDICEASIEIIKGLMKARNLPAANAIVCGLPWASFPEILQDTLLNATYEAMQPGAIFTTFAYLQGTLLPAGQRFKKKITGQFAEVRKSPVVWRNLPPAFVYTCKK